MNWKAFWTVFGLTQFLGSLGAATGSPHGNPLGLALMMILLFPGSTLCWWVLDVLRLTPTGNMTGRIILTALVINIACWCAFAVVVSKLRGKRTH